MEEKRPKPVPAKAPASNPAGVALQNVTPAASTLEMPPTFLVLRVHDLMKAPSVSGLCVGYEAGKWRAEQLVRHLMEWLPEFALTHSEREGLTAASAVALIRQAAQTVYKTEKFKNRGEFGELLLHVAIRQAFNSVPAISKIYYKTAANETVKGFDAVHVVGEPDDMELWLGEAKFYDDVRRAVKDVVAELKVHATHDYLRGEFMLIKGKIDPALPHSQALIDLLDHRKSLDEVFKRIVIPVLLSYDSDCVAGYTECSESYQKAFAAEIAKHYASFAGSGLPKELRVHLFLLPLKSKAELVAQLDEQLKTWQKI
jgi:hypothetical protein